MRYAAMLLILLAGCKKDVGIQPRRTAGADSADQVYSGMTTEVVRDGVRQSHVYADSAWAYQTRQLVDLTRMTVTMFDSNGTKVSTIVADKGIYHTRQQSLDARGHVVATSSGGKVLRTEHLIYDRDRNQISSDTAFTSTSPQGNAAGVSFESDPGFKRVRITQPKLLQKGKGILIGGSSGGEL
jgi:LPS export ABC transporter protein LptC